MRRVCYTLAFAATAALAAPDSGVDPGGRTLFIGEHRCAIAERLEAIHRRGSITVSRDRFIVLTLHAHPQRYVQCIFQNRDMQMLCEAASGAYGPPGGDRLRLNASALAALAALHFVQDGPRENFARIVELGDPPDVGIAADLMLATLHDAYGARPGAVLDIAAPRGGTLGRGCGTPGS